jgi:hypothetical protein
MSGYYARLPLRPADGAPRRSRFPRAISVGARKYDVDWENVGRVRAAGFIMAPYDFIVATPATQLADVMEGYAEACAALLALMLVLSFAIGRGGHLD